MSIRSADRAWKKWGRIDPYFGVLTDESYRAKRLTDAAKQEFFRSGEKHVEDVFATVRACIDPEFQPAVTVDFGCGAGRLLIPLGRRSKKVIGVDISESMLQEARKNCESQRVGNATFLDSIDDLASAAPFDFVHSFIVFQHMPRKAGMRALRQLLDGLSSRGVIALHFTVHRDVSPIRKLAIWLRHNVPGAHEAMQLVTRRPIGDPPMQMNSYDLAAILRVLERRGIREIHSRFTDHGGHLGIMIIARRASAEAC